MLNNISVEGLIALPALMVGFLVAIAIFNFEDSKRGLQIDVPTVISQVVKVDVKAWPWNKLVYGVSVKLPCR